MEIWSYNVKPDGSISYAGVNVPPLAEGEERYQTSSRDGGNCQMRPDCYVWDFEKGLPVEDENISEILENKERKDALVAALALIDQYRDLKFTKAHSFEVTGSFGTVNFHYDEVVINRLFNKLPYMDDDFVFPDFKTADKEPDGINNVKVALTKNDIYLLSEAGEAYFRLHWGIGESKKVQIKQMFIDGASAKELSAFPCEW